MSGEDAQEEVSQSDQTGLPSYGDDITTFQRQMADFLPLPFVVLCNSPLSVIAGMTASAVKILENKRMDTTKLIGEFLIRDRHIKRFEDYLNWMCRVSSEEQNYRVWTERVAEALACYMHHHLDFSMHQIEEFRNTRYEMITRHTQNEGSGRPRNYHRRDSD